MEEWRNIDGYEGLYQVSNFGRVNSFNYLRSKQEKILKPGKKSDGYLQIKLCKDGKKQIFYIHRLVSQTFLPNPNNLPQVNHKDENKENNFVFVNEDGSVNNEKSNLEWCDAKYNSNYGTCQKRRKKWRSKQVYQYSLQGELIKMWQSTAECARNGFAQSNVSNCCNGVLKTYKGCIWKYQ